jgi:hypothetical protein
MSGMLSANTLLARLECSFKGETVVLASVIDLDRCLANSADAPDFHQALARAGGIDAYSYLYEVLESEEIQFSEPTGLAIDCCAEGSFDWEAFVQKACHIRDTRVVQAIAKREMGVDDLDAQAGLKAALLAAYGEGWRAGQAASR